MKTETEKAVEDMKHVWVKLTNVHSYNHLEKDTLRHEGDVVEVEAGRAAALIEQGHATKANKPRRKK